MPAQVLGLDIGSVTIKALLLERKGRFGGRILALDTINIAESGGIGPALMKLGENKIFTGVPCSVSLPIQDIMFRQVTLPFRDDGKIRKTLPFELEPIIPFPVDDITADYLPAADGRFLVAVTTRKNIRDWIAMIEGSLGEVPLMDVSSAPLVSLLPEKSAGVVSGVLLDIGSISTMMNFYENGSLVQIRSLAFGTDSLAAALADDCSIPLEEAKQRVISADYGNSGAQVANSLLRFCLEIKNTIEFLMLNETLKKYPEKITLTGGGSLFPALPQELKNHFPLPVEVFDLRRTRQIEIEEGIRDKYHPQIMNGALANALRLFAGLRSFNFRQGEFKPRKESGKLYARLKWALPVAGLILVLAVVNEFLDYRLQAQKLDSIKKQISHLFKKNYPDAATMVDPLSQLKTKLADNRKTLGFYEGGNEVPVLDLLREISVYIMPSLDIILTNFSYENEVILIRGEAKNIDAVSAVKNELMKSKHFKEVMIGSTNLARQGGKVEFDLRITLK
jgi:type II secretory pathway component PulL